jgi:predicted small lipoprotein YifL
MSRRSRRAALHAAAALLLLAASGCGKKGPLLPPLRIVPQAAEDLRASQRGARVILEWVNPPTYNDGSALPGIAAIEIWEGAAIGDFPAKARLILTLAAADLEGLRTGPGPASRAFAFSFVPSEPAAPAGTARLYALKIIDARRKRASEFTVPASVLYVPVPRPPAGLAAETEETRIVLTWTPPAANADGTAPAALGGYVVLRSEGDEAPRRMTERPLAEPRYEDTDFAFDRAYRYVVRAAASAAVSAESEDSAPLEIKPRDTFPPAVPAGLSASAGGSVITLLWEAGRESDLAGYRIWRREAGGEWAALASDMVAGSATTDASAAPGVRYEYAVSAVDAAGNESARSAPAAAVLRPPKPIVIA